MENLQSRQQLIWIRNVDPSTGRVFYTSAEGDLILSNTSVNFATTASYALNVGEPIDTGSLLTTASFASPRLTFTKGDGTDFTLSLDSLVVNSASYATIASSVTSLPQTVVIGSSVTASNTENPLSIYPLPGAGTGEGGQILLAASGGIWTSASMLDTYQNQFRILKGTNTGGSNAGWFSMNLNNGNSTFIGAVTASAYSGLPNAWLYAARNSNQTISSGTWASRDIIFNDFSSNNFTYNISTGIATLRAGKTYRITARLAWSAAGIYTLKFRVYNQTTSVYIGPTVELIQSPNGTFNVSDNTLDFIFPLSSTDVDISIRTTADTNALSGEFIRSDLNTQLIIQQIA
jgi:hypothetical protein